MKRWDNRASISVSSRPDPRRQAGPCSGARPRARLLRWEERPGEVCTGIPEAGPVLKVPHSGIDGSKGCARDIDEAGVRLNAIGASLAAQGTGDHLLCALLVARIFSLDGRPVFMSTLVAQLTLGLVLSAEISSPVFASST